MTESPWLVVGLGNPGPGYAQTRHNIGYMVADALAERAGGRWKSHKPTRADVVEGRLGGPSGVRVVLGRSRGYMNESGGAVKALATFYKVPSEQLVVVYDELDLPYETMRVKLGGGDNGHNGLKSIRASLGTGDYYKVRVGIGRPPGRQSPADYVLKPFSSTERKELPLVVETAADAVETLLTSGLEVAQREFNS
ncbi:aminoacyl-tRNA hydrolase [Mumia sp. zg.B17]|uniref:aminoacyl-tRNA hydrolase n=1 Tax=Mumia sp. zg.B17 TaxID=2855446 RepID=UPI001C6DFFFB|nr:aminoacyl-tRNA hydrolase [Mumia sp. zg.B17]MBW9206914.1 aminoacyl-tRNA hydrolase [Mumia sp. zg.B17]